MTHPKYKHATCPVCNGEPWRLPYFPCLLCDGNGTVLVLVDAKFQPTDKGMDRLVKDLKL